jgi:hypothetical protein
LYPLVGIGCSSDAHQDFGGVALGGDPTGLEVCVDCLLANGVEDSQGWTGAAEQGQYSSPPSHQSTKVCR